MPSRKPVKRRRWRVESSFSIYTIDLSATKQDTLENANNGEGKSWEYLSRADVVTQTSRAFRLLLTWRIWSDFSVIAAKIMAPSSVANTTDATPRAFALVQLGN